jgi:hypothetical protein
MLQDFSFKIIHRPGLRHTNVDALSRNPVGSAADDDDFDEEIQDVADTQAGVSGEQGELLYVQTGQDTEWMGVRRKDRRFVQHEACCFGINHWTYSGNHQLFMLDVISEEDPSKESVPDEEAMIMNDEPMQLEEARMVSKRRRPQHFGRRQQMELVLAAQELSEVGDHELGPTESDHEEDHAVKPGCIDIWEDTSCLMLLKEGVLPETVDFEEGKRIRKRASNYCWKEQKLFFKTLLIPKPEDRVSLVRRMHEDLGHFGEKRTLIEIRQRYFWHNRTVDVKAIVRGCQQCQLVRSSGSLCSGNA